MSNVTLGIKPIKIRNDSFYVDGVEVAWVPGYENMYAVSREGRIWSAPRMRPDGIPIRKGRWLKYTGKYPKIRTPNINGKTHLYVHRAVAEVWVYNPNKEEYHEVDHWLRDPSYNDASNLIWTDRTGNILNSAQNGTENGYPDIERQKQRVREYDRTHRDQINANSRARRAAKKAEAQAQAEAGE